MLQLLRAAAATLAVSAAVVQAADMISCSTNSPCPSSAPCCSTYGYCGVGAYCLGGCDPAKSFDLQSCMAAPICKSEDYKMDSLDQIQSNSLYLGDASQANWVSSGTPVAYQNEAVLLTMAPDTVGTLLSSTRYVWYGKISATMTSSQGAGVVTAFILMSDVHDEIDFEFVGTDVQTVQSNYYWQGVTDCTYMACLCIATLTNMTQTPTPRTSAPPTRNLQYILIPLIGSLITSHGRSTIKSSVLLSGTRRTTRRRANTTSLSLLPGFSFLCGPPDLPRTARVPLTGPVVR